MGLIDFVVNAGKKLFGAESAEAAKSPDPDVQSKRSSALENEIKTLGLNVEGLKIKVAEQTVYVRGKVKTQADKEKVVLALGNVDGIAKVDDGGLEVGTARDAAGGGRAGARGGRPPGRRDVAGGGRRSKHEKKPKRGFCGRPKQVPDDF